MAGFFLAHRRPTQEETMTEVRRNEEARRFELLVDGEVAGFSEFHRRRDGTLVLPHTRIEEAHRGEGLSGVLIEGALDDIRAHGERLVARCPAVARFIDEHDRDADLLAEPLTRDAS